MVFPSMLLSSRRFAGQYDQHQGTECYCNLISRQDAPITTLHHEYSIIVANLYQATNSSHLCLCPSVHTTLSLLQFLHSLTRGLHCFLLRVVPPFSQPLTRSNHTIQETNERILVLFSDSALTSHTTLVVRPVYNITSRPIN